MNLCFDPLSDIIMGADNDAPHVGLFWRINGAMLAAGTPVSNADRYGDCLTFDGGHADLWDEWASSGSAGLKKLGLPQALLFSEYDEHPRGRVVFELRSETFVIYADRRLHGLSSVEAIRRRFGLPAASCEVRSDLHYR